jgi:integrase/recombinase XerD
MLRKDLLQKAVDDYLVNYSIEAGLMEKTVRNKKGILLRFLKYLDGKPYSQENVKSFLSYLFNNGWNTPNSRLDLVKVFRAFTNFLYKRKYIKENFAQDLVKPRVPKKDFNYISPETVEKIIEAGTEIGTGDRARSIYIKSETKLALRFLLRTGLRINELLQLKGMDLNLYDDPPTYFVNSKGGNRELLPLPKDMLEELLKRSERHRVFEVTKETCNDVLQRGAKKLGIKTEISNHSLRHIFASNLVKNKVPIQMVSRLMRHSSVTITDKTYSHLDATDLALILNNQRIVTRGLTSKQIFDNIIQALEVTGIRQDNRFNIQIMQSEELLQITLSAK